MARVILVMASTFLGALLGILIGYLTMQAQLEIATPANRVRGGELLVSYLVAPLLAAAIGFALSVATLKIFGPPP